MHGAGYHEQIDDGHSCCLVSLSGGDISRRRDTPGLGQSEASVYNCTEFQKLKGHGVGRGGEGESFAQEVCSSMGNPSISW